MARGAVRGGGHGPRRHFGRDAERPYGGRQLTVGGLRGLLRIVTDTDVRLWRRVHMDLVRYAGCVCRPSC
ncbi:MULTISPECIES: putative leader peptide [Streptomyces]|uniref:putative leader peptide n=1 Tax=Streptomyces TaxID=1883 RepID=UPI00332E43D2